MMVNTRRCQLVFWIFIWMLSYVSALPALATQLVLPVEDDFLKGSIIHKGGGPTGSLLYEGLVTKNSQGGYDGWLARFWKSEENARIWTFSLVKNAIWHDGVPFTAQDVKFTYDYFEQKQLWLAAVLWMVDRVECPDDYTVVFRLKCRFPKFLDHLSHCPGIAVIPKHIWESIENPMQYEDYNYIGSGPFQFVKKIPGQFFEMKAFDRYHGKKSAFSRLVLRVLKNTDMRILALKSGSIDAVDDILPWVAAALDKDENIKVSAFPKQRLYELCFNCREYPPSSPYLRRALAYAIDREKICKMLFHGHAQPATTWLMPHLASDYIKKELFPYTFNLNRARRLLERGGFRIKNGRLQDRQGKDVRLIFTLGAKGNVSIVKKMAEVFREDWKRLGIVVDIKQVDFSMWFKEVHRNHIFIIGMPDLMHDDADDLAHFRSRSFFGKPNWHGYSNPNYDRLAAQLHEANKPTRRKTLAFAMQEILAADVPSVAICEVDGLTAFRSDKIAEKESLDSMYGGILDLKTLLSIKPVCRK